MDGTTIFLAINTGLLSVVVTLVGVIYRDWSRRISRMDRQIIASLVALIALVNQHDPVPEKILKDLEGALKEDER